MNTLSPDEIAVSLRKHPDIRSKLAIAKTVEYLELSNDSNGRPGDDAAIIPHGKGYDLLAGEGFIPEFVQEDPWFAGWCGVMVNLSDIAAMGGYGVGVVNQIWAPSADEAAPLLSGLKAASQTYNVPIVGGHTNFSTDNLNLAVSIMGRAENLITSFDASPGNILLAAIDMRGAYRNYDNFFAAHDVPHDRLRSDLNLLQGLANDHLVTAGKDISQGGMAGTALMLAECSGVGIDIDIEKIVPPQGISVNRWMRTFPSFGFLLAVSPDNVQTVRDRFVAREIQVNIIGDIMKGSQVRFKARGQTALFWDYAKTPYLNFSLKEYKHA